MIIHEVAFLAARSHNILNSYNIGNSIAPETNDAHSKANACNTGSDHLARNKALHLAANLLPVHLLLNFLITLGSLAVAVMAQHLVACIHLSVLAPLILWFLDLGCNNSLSLAELWPVVFSQSATQNCEARPNQVWVLALTGRKEVGEEEAAT